MISESVARTAIPKGGWLEAYVAHAERQTTAPLVYHLGVGASILSVACKPSFGMRYGTALRPNLYTLLVGRSGEDQKSSAIAVGKEVLSAAAPGLIGDYPGSPEGLLESLARTPTQLIPISELGKMLASAKQRYFEPVKALLTDLWDAQPLQRTKANNKIVRVGEPRLSLCAACSIPYLEAYTLEEDWEGGFLGRWMVLYGRRERVNPFPQGDMRLFSGLVEGFVERASSDQPPGPFVGYTPLARELWEDWFHTIMGMKSTSMIAGVASRAPAIALKLAMIYAWDFGKARDGQPWQLDLPELEPAIRLATMHVVSAEELSKVIAPHPEARLRRQVLQAFVKLDKKGTLGDLLRVTQYKKRSVLEVLEGLQEEGLVERETTPDGFVYILVKDIPVL